MNRANYYECHITTDPVFDLELKALKSTADFHHFQVADLVMIKSLGGKMIEIPSEKDAFITGRHMDFNVLYERMMALIKDIKSLHIPIRRYKIEKTLLDSKHYDILRLNDVRNANTRTEKDQSRL